MLRLGRSVSTWAIPGADIPIRASPFQRSWELCHRSSVSPKTVSGFEDLPAARLCGTVSPGTLELHLLSHYHRHSDANVIAKTDINRQHPVSTRRQMPWDAPGAKKRGGWSGNAAGAGMLYTPGIMSSYPDYPIPGCFIRATADNPTLAVQDHPFPWPPFRGGCPPRSRRAYWRTLGRIRSFDARTLPITFNPAGQ